MKQKVKSIRPFIGAQNFEISRKFYSDLGFEELVLEPNLSLFKKEKTAFYLQDAYVKDWIENSVFKMQWKYFFVASPGIEPGSKV